MFGFVLSPSIRPIGEKATPTYHREVRVLEAKANECSLPSVLKVRAAEAPPVHGHRIFRFRACSLNQMLKSFIQARRMHTHLSPEDNGIARPESKLRECLRG